MKIHKILGIFFILVFASACNSGENSLSNPPENLIPRDKMINVLVDIHLVEASMTQFYGVTNDLKSKANIFYALLFKKYAINKTDFINSLNYYAQDLKYLDKMYQEVITRLSVIQTPVRQSKP